MQPDPPDLDELVSSNEASPFELEPEQVVVVDRRRGGLPWALVPVLIALSVATGIIVSRPDRPVRPWLVAQRVEGPIVTAPRDDSGPREEPAPAPAAAVPATEVVAVEPQTPPEPDLAPPAPQKRTVLRPTGIGFDPGAEAAVAKDKEKKPAPESAPPQNPAPAPVAAPLPAPTPKPPANPEPAPVPSPVQATEPVEAQGAQVPAPVPTEEVNADIAREAEAKRKERQALEDAKPELLRPDPAVLRAQQEAEEAEARAVAKADRGQFHVELTRILKEAGGEAASEIQALCATSPHSVPESAKKRVSKFLAGPGAGVRRATRIKVLRSYGFPEAMILSDIAEQEMKHVGSRSGPNRLDQVWVLAARILLSFPPNPAPAATGRAGQALPQ